MDYFLHVMWDHYCIYIFLLLFIKSDQFPKTAYSIGLEAVDNLGLALFESMV